jgi:serine protease Do
MPTAKIRHLTLRTLFAVCAVPVFCAAQSSGAQNRSDDALHKLNESVDALIRKVSPSVVQILVAGYGPVEESHGNTSVVIGKQKAIGSGFVVDPAGYIITNAHVVSGAQVVQVVLPSGNPDGSLQSLLSTKTNIVTAHVVGVSKEIDLALLKVDNIKLEALAIAPYRNLRQGEVVLAFGSPEGLRNTVTLGVVSSVARQTDPDSPMVYIRPTHPSIQATPVAPWSMWMARSSASTRSSCHSPEVTKDLVSRFPAA